MDIILERLASHYINHLMILLYNYMHKSGQELQWINTNGSSLPLLTHCSGLCFLCRGADFYPGVDSLCYGGSGKVSKEGVEKMVADLEKQ